MEQLFLQCGTASGGKGPSLPSGERIPQALHVKSAPWMHAKSSDPARPAAIAPLPNGTLHTLHEVRASGAMIPQPGQIRRPCISRC